MFGTDPCCPLVAKETTVTLPLTDVKLVLVVELRIVVSLLFSDFQMSSVLFFIRIMNNILVFVKSCVL